jgi:ABC-type Fe3+/spermidine/putrescine transport system ATPase subunit
MVFQNYALFPHMSVSRNVAFGLESRALSKKEIGNRVEKVLDAVGMQGRGDDAVSTLSGGEQQRVALARAMVVKPSVLLLDEPLSNLDVTLRLRTRGELRSLQRSTRMTMVYVTHDQAEAMSLSDRIAVMCDGRIEQAGRPSELYESPATPFVARFICGAMLLDAAVGPDGDNLSFGGVTVPLAGEGAPWAQGRALAAIRPEAVLLSAEGPGCPAVVTDVEYLGLQTAILVTVGGEQLRAIRLTGGGVAVPGPGEKVKILFDRDLCSRFPPESF